MSLKRIIQKVKAFFFGSGKREKIVGKIKFFDRKKRFGFIVAGQHEYFFHAAATNPRDRNSLRDGVEVRFMIVQGKKGPQADKVEVI